MNLGAREKTTPPWQNRNRKTRHDCLTNTRNEESPLVPFVGAHDRFIVGMPFEHLRVCNRSSTFVQNTWCVCVTFWFFYGNVIDGREQEGGRKTFSPSCHMVGVWVEKFARVKLGTIGRAPSIIVYAGQSRVDLSHTYFLITYCTAHFKDDHHQK